MRGWDTRRSARSARPAPGTAPSAIRPRRENSTFCSTRRHRPSRRHFKRHDTCGCRFRVVDHGDEDLALVARGDGCAEPDPAPQPERRGPERRPALQSRGRPRATLGRRRTDGRRRQNDDLRRYAYRQRGHDQQVGPLLPAENVALIAILDRQPVDHLVAARERQRHLHVERRGSIRQAERRVGVEGVAPGLALAVPVRLGGPGGHGNRQRRLAPSQPDPS